MTPVSTVIIVILGFACLCTPTGFTMVYSANGDGLSGKEWSEPASGSSPKAPLLLFVSYSHKQTTQARLFAEKLRAMGHRTWQDVDNIHAGYWDDQIDNGLKACDALIGLVTSDSVASKNVLNEWACVDQAEKPLILVELERCDIPHRFIRLQRLYFRRNDIDGFFAELESQLANVSRRRAHIEAADEADSVAQAEIESSRKVPASGDAADLDTIRELDTNMREIRWMLPGDDGELWLTDGQKVEAFRLDRSDPVRRRVLPARRWKAIHPLIWRGHVLCSDWDGNLVAFDLDAGRQGRQMRQARFPDLPVHMVAAGADGELFAATWDGQILAWDRGGEARPVKAAVTGLPLCMAPLDGGGLAVADDAGQLHQLDSDLGPVCTWSTGARLRSVWGYRSDDGHHALFAITEADEIIRAIAGDENLLRLKVEGGITALGHRAASEGERWSALATGMQTLRWLDWTTAQLVDSVDAPIPFRARRLLAIRDPTRPTALCAVGLSETSEIFSTHYRAVKRHSAPRADDIAVDPSGHFLFARAGGRVLAYRNPTIADPHCSARVVGIEGELVLGAFNEIVLVLENDGGIAIRHIIARLKGEGRIEPRELRVEERLPPGTTTRLALSVRALASGSKVPVNLDLEIEDEAGPPPIILRFDLLVAVREG